MARMHQRFVAVLVSSALACALVGWFVRWRDREAATVQVKTGGASLLLADVERSERSGLLRRPLSDAEIERFHTELSPFVERDPLSLFHYRASIDAPRRFAEHPAGRFQLTTNRLGLRNSREVLAAHPDLRVLVTGDSHTDGVCATDETYSARLQALLSKRRPDWSVEVLNAGCGGYSFDNYLGVLERLESLRPDVFVVCVFGGNDFSDSLALRAAFEGLAPPASFSMFADVLERAADASHGAVYQGLASAKYFTRFPEEVESALDGALAVSREIIATCRANDVVPVFLYLPPVHDVQWELRRDALQPIADLLNLSPDDLRVLDRIAERFLAELRRCDVSAIDLRPAFRAAGEPLYWESDGHLNLAGQVLVARRLEPVLLDARLERSSHRGEATDATPSSRPMPGWRELFTDVEREPFSEAPLDREVLEAWVEFGELLQYDVSSGLRLAKPLESVSNESGPRNARTIVVLGDETTFDPDVTSRLREALAARRRAESDPEPNCRNVSTPGAGVERSVLAARAKEFEGAAAFVLVVNADNDFLDSTSLAALASGRRLAGESERRSPLDPRWQWLRSSLAFRERPRSAREGVRRVARALLQLQSECSDRGSRLVVVVAPPATSDECVAVRESVAALAAEHGLGAAHVHATERLASGLASFAADRGIRVVELTPREPGECLHDPVTFRLNATALGRLAEALADDIASSGGR